MKIQFRDYFNDKKSGGYIYSKKKFNLDYGDMTIAINPNTEFQLFKYNDGRITVERMKSGVRIKWIIDQDILNEYFKRNPSKASVQTEIMEV